MLRCSISRFSPGSSASLSGFDVASTAIAAFAIVFSGLAALASPSTPAAENGASDGTSASLLDAARTALELPRLEGAEPPEGPPASSRALAADIDRVWAAVHTLRERFPGDQVEAYRPLEGRVLELATELRFVAAALVLIELPERERSLRTEAETALRRTILSADEPLALREAAVQLLVEEGDAESFGNLRAIKGALETATDPELRIASAYALWWATRARYQLAPILSLLDSAEFRIRARTALVLASTGEFAVKDGIGKKIDSILARLEREPSERGREASRLRAAAESGGSFSGPGEREPRSVPPSEDSVRSPELRHEPASDELAMFAAWLRSAYYAPAEVSEEHLLFEGLKALVGHLDRHARIIEPKSDGDARELVPGQYFGLGVRLDRTRPGEPLVVARSYYGSPAFEREANASGRLLTGDRILEINGIPTADRTLDDIHELLDELREGDPVLLVVARGVDPPRPLRLRYGTVLVPPISAERVAPAIGVIRLRSFSLGTRRAFETAYEELASEGPPLEGLILDLRDNAGGVLEEATSIVDLFVAGESETRPIISERRFDGSPPIDHLPSSGRRITVPVVVLVNSWTASAAEVVAGSLQAYDRAIVAGERTWGKGVAQDTFEVPRGVRELIGGPVRVRVPTRYLVLPNGLGFHRGGPGDSESRGGIVPDVPVSADPILADERLLEAFYAPETNAYLYARSATVEAVSAAERWKPDTHPDLDELRSRLARERGIHVSSDELLEVLRRLSWRHADDREGHRRSRSPDDDRTLERAIELLRG